MSDYFSADPSAPVAPADCTGEDRHDIGLTPIQSLAFGVPGAVITALCLSDHIYTRPLGTGLGLLLIPILATLFRQRIDGPVVKVRRWGVPSTFRLDTATSVAMAKTRNGRQLVRTLVVTGPDSSKPVKISIGMNRQLAVRSHLARWLLRDGVTQDPFAVAVLGNRVTVKRPTNARAIRQLQWLMVGIAVTFVLAEIVLLTLIHHRHHGYRASAPGPFTNCTPAPSANAIPAAREYQDDLNAAYSGWVAVTHAMVADNIDITTAEIVEQRATDKSFDSAIRQITFPSSAANTAAAYEAVIDKYRADLGTALTQGYDSVQRLIAEDAEERAALSDDLASELGLPVSGCLILRP